MPLNSSEILTLSISSVSYGNLDLLLQDRHLFICSSSLWLISRPSRAQILALNCLTSAYMLSALYLKGVKQGDGQMTVLGLVISAFFYCASRSQPLRRLSAARPPVGIFGAQACSSVLGQFVVHLSALLALSQLCEGHVNAEDPSVMPDGPFRPNTFNSSVFLLSWVMQVKR